MKKDCDMKSAKMSKKTINAPKKAVVKAVKSKKK